MANLFICKSEKGDIEIEYSMLDPSVKNPESISIEIKEGKNNASNRYKPTEEMLK